MWRAAAHCFPFEVINCLLSGDDCMNLFWRHLSVCVLSGDVNLVLRLPIEQSLTAVLQNPTQLHYRLSVVRVW